jgi:hypothetical protein
VHDCIEQDMHDYIGTIFVHDESSSTCLQQNGSCGSHWLGRTTTTLPEVSAVCMHTVSLDAQDMPPLLLLQVATH